MYPSVASPDVATKPRMDARTGVEQGEAMRAEVAPSKKAWRLGENRSSCTVASKEGRRNETRSRRLSPMTMATTDAVSGSTAPRAPAPAFGWGGVDWTGVSCLVERQLERWGDGRLTND